ncbi:MAG: nucleotidyltransferase [Armatimonadetes bacterium]|nr:nucleotidyltransferase [Armatimonadota bacterium]
MSDPTLVVMAAGMGSRYGGLKQIDPIGPNGEIILDYSAYDAIKAGFGKIVFVIRRDLEDAFRERVGKVLENRVDVAYVFQELTNLPAGFSVPEGRVKPWGTGHAVLSCKGAVSTPFAVINADDYYGAAAFQLMGDYLRQARDQDGVYDYCLVGYELTNTLSKHGTVARGVCELTPDGFLKDIRERTAIRRFPDGIKYTENGVDWVVLEPKAMVSLNTWGFTLSILDELEARFKAFLKTNVANLLKAEYFMPEVVGDLVNENKARVKVLPTGERWFGVTYQEDRPIVQAAIQELIERGVYPEKLWSRDT